MKNNFNLEVSFSESPALPYEWNETSFLTHLKLERVSSSFLRDVLNFEAIIKYDKANMLISDAKEAIVLRLNKDGKVLKRSFLKFDDALDVIEFASNLKEAKIEYTPLSKRIEYKRGLSIEKEMQEYILDRVEKSKDEDFSKYLYFLYSGEIEDYSKETLIQAIKTSPLDKNMTLYKFLIES